MKKYAYFVHKLNGQLFGYKFTTFTLKDNQVNYFRITVIKKVVWDPISRLRMICATDLDTHARLERFRFEYALEDIFRLKSPNTLSYYLAVDQWDDMEVFMSTKW